MKDIKKYFFHKIVFPKRVMVDKPGIIVNQLSQKYGGVKNKQRTVFFFEDVLVALQKETERIMGKNKSSKFWYDIGKSVGERYISLGGVRSIPFSLIPFVIDYVFLGFRSGGLSLAKNISFDSENESLVLSGRNNMVCRKTGDPSFFTGIIDVVYSSLIGKSASVNMKCKSCPNGCKIAVCPKLNSKSVLSVEDSSIFQDYEKLNFSKTKTSFDKLYSFSDLMKFNEVSIDIEGKFNFKNCAIIASEAGVLDLIVDKFRISGNLDIIENTLPVESEKLSEKFLDKNFPPRRNVGIIKKILCAFGWGIPDIKVNEEDVTFVLFHPPVSKYEFYYLPLLLNGYLNNVFGRKLKLESIKKSKDFCKIVVKYSF